MEEVNENSTELESLDHGLFLQRFRCQCQRRPDILKQMLHGPSSACVAPAPQETRRHIYSLGELIFFCTHGKNTEMSFWWGKKRVKHQLGLSLFWFCWLNCSTWFRSWQTVKIHFVVIVREMRTSSACKTKGCIFKIPKLPRNFPEINWIYCWSVQSSYIPNLCINPFGK